LIKAKSFKLNHGLFIIGMDIGFAIEWKTRGHKCNDRDGYPYARNPESR